jgi:2-hydroxychromene-2-carboxylate isomerase
MSAQFYFDVGSPYVYLTVSRLALDDAEWKPISLGGLWKLNGRGSWALTGRREAGMAEIEERAARYGLPPVKWPDPWPGRYLSIMRACLVAGEAGVLPHFVRNCGQMAFVEGRDLSGLDSVWRAALLSGLDPVTVNERITEPEIKQRLIDETQAAHDRGVIGVPTLADGDRLLWGDDQIR